MKRIKMTACNGCQYGAEAGELTWAAGQCQYCAGVHEFVNLTPHSVVVAGTEFPASGEVLRLATDYERVGTLGNGFALSRVSQKLEVEPPVVEGRYYIVSAMIGQAVSRPDFICPDTNRAKRNELGHIVSVPGFVQY